MSSAQMIVAHRGASFDAPENTLSAFQLAWKQEADGIEADFQLTKDGQIVCIHDANTRRTGGTPLDVAGSTLAELRRLEYGSWKARRFSGEPLPTFADVMRAVPPGKMFVAELKTGPEIVAVLKSELDRLQPDLSQLLLISFQKETIVACRQSIPKARTHWLIAFRQDQLTGDWHPTWPEVVRGLLETGADGLGIEANRAILTESFVGQLSDHGLREFHVWTVDDPNDATFFKSVGAVAITTNHPGLIRRHLNQ